MKRITLGGRRIPVPFFAATVADDERLWSWTRGVVPDALLVSYDVLRKKPARTTAPLAQTLNFAGCVLVDSGGYGTSTETDPGAVYRLQRTVGANVGIVLDKLPFAEDPARRQWAAIRQTIRNVRSIRRRHRGGMTLEGVVQGATNDQLASCSRDLAKLRLRVYGVPVSMQAKYRRYGRTLERIAYGISALSPGAAIHALGCGSRSLIAILSYFGVEIFDSRSYYQRALYHENLASVTMCALGTPRNKPGCGVCLERRRPGRTLESRTDYNLSEILKEVTRVRCAIEESMMDEYLERRLRRKVFNEISVAIERLTVDGRRRVFPFLTEARD